MVTRPSYEIVSVRGKTDEAKRHSDPQNLHSRWWFLLLTFSPHARMYVYAQRCAILFNWHLSILEFIETIRRFSMIQDPRIISRSCSFSSKFFIGQFIFLFNAKIVFTTITRYDILRQVLVGSFLGRISLDMVSSCPIPAISLFSLS